MVRTTEGVRSIFPKPLRSRLDVAPQFEPEELPNLLVGCSLGVFPSHCEGFGFGVLEMLAAGLLVFAYNAPGSPEMLPPDYLVPRGDGAALGRRVADLLTDAARLQVASQWARRQPARFLWDEMSRRTADRYIASVIARTERSLCPCPQGSKAGPASRGGRRTMNVLRLADIPNNRTGGMSRYMQFVADEIRAAGHRVEMVFADELSAGLAPRLRRFIVPLRVVKAIRRRLAVGHRYDAVDVHEPIAAAYALARRFDRSLPPLIACVYALELRAAHARLSYDRLHRRRTSWLSRLGALPILLQSAFALRSADQVTVETEEDLEYLRTRLGVSPDRVNLLHGGASPLFFDPPPGSPNASERRGVLFVGSWIERKGIRELQPALAAVLAVYPNTPITLAGLGVAAEQVRANLPPVVQVRARILSKVEDDRRLADLYHEHAIFAFPSTFEGQPLVLLEAAAAGLAIVTTRTCGMRDFVRHGENGLLCEIGDAAGFAAAVNRLVADHGLRAALGPGKRRRTTLHLEEIGGTVSSGR